MLGRPVLAGLGEGAHKGRKESSPYLHLLLHLRHFPLQGSPLLFRNNETVEHLLGLEGGQNAASQLPCDQQWHVPGKPQAGG